MELRRKTYNKCCRGCVHFHDEDIEGCGWCCKRDAARHCSDSCGYYEQGYNKFKAL